MAERRKLHPAAAGASQSCVELRFRRCAYHDGSLRLLTMIDEFSRECLAIRVARRLNSAHVIELLGGCMLAHGTPGACPVG